MDLMEFTGAVGRLSGQDIRSVSLAIAAHRTCAEEEVRWWVTSLAVERQLQLAGREMVAAAAGLQAAARVQRAARVADMTVFDADVSRVARAAAQVAKALVGGQGTQAELAYFLGCWHTYLPVPGSESPPAAPERTAEPATETPEGRAAVAAGGGRHLPAAVPL